jgi:hypothetical protein
MARRRRVAVLVDDSPGSMRACRYGAKHLLDKDTDVMLVTAVHDSADPPAVRTESSLGTSETPKAFRAKRTVCEHVRFANLRVFLETDAGGA